MTHFFVNCLPINAIRKKQTATLRFSYRQGLLCVMSKDMATIYFRLFTLQYNYIHKRLKYYICPKFEKSVFVRLYVFRAGCRIPGSCTGTVFLWGYTVSQNAFRIVCRNLRPSFSDVFCRVLSENYCILFKKSAISFAYFIYASFPCLSKRLGLPFTSKL